MRLINENVEREAEGADIQKWKNRGYAELETEEIPSDSAEDCTGIKRTCKIKRLRGDKFFK